MSHNEKGFSMLHKGYKIPQQILKNGNKVYGREARPGGRSNWFYACKKAGCKVKIKHTIKVWDFCRAHDENVVHGMLLRGPLLAIKDKIVNVKILKNGKKVPLVACAYNGCSGTLSARDNQRLGHMMCVKHNVFDPGKQIARGRLTTSAAVLQARGLIHHSYRIARNQIRYAIKCKNAQCDGYISLGRFAKGLRYCKSCRPRVFGTYFLTDPILLPLLRKLRRVERKAGWKNPRAWAKCAKYGCHKEVLLDRKNIEFRWCDDCAAKQRKLFGVVVKDDRIWDMRHLIVGVAKGKKRSLWKIRCATDGCEKTVVAARAVNHAKFYCFTCSHHRRAVPYGHAFHRLQVTATDRKLKCSLTFAEFSVIRNGKHCYYCNEDMSVYAKKRSLSLLDRVDVQKGYSKDNVVLCCPWCNRTKNATLTPNEMSMIGALRSGEKHKAIALLKQIDFSEHIALKKVWGRRKVVDSG